MSLNKYKNEVKEFMINMKSFSGDNQEKIVWLEEEFDLLKKAVNISNRDKIEHQVYDMLYLLFEIAADNDLDLDKQWQAGNIKKREKYIQK